MAVVSVGAIHGGDAPNVIPGEVELRLSVRAYRPEVRALLRERITALAHAQAATLGADGGAQKAAAAQDLAGLGGERRCSAHGGNRR